MTHFGKPMFLDALADVSAMRQADPAKLSRFVKGDLDWIVMKSLEKDRTRRYETANAMAADVNRYLNHDTVDATPPSSLYRFQKFARKNRKVLAVATAFALLLTGGTVVSTWQAVQKEKERQKTALAKKDAVEAREEAVRQRDVADRARHTAEQATQEMQALVCRKDMILAGHAWSEGNINRVSDLLRHHVPSGNEKDLRSFDAATCFDARPWGDSVRGVLAGRANTAYGRSRRQGAILARRNNERGRGDRLATKGLIYSPSQCPINQARSSGAGGFPWT